MPRLKPLSDFMVRELLYDFVSNQLEPDRASLINEKIKSSETIQRDLNNLRTGLDFAKQLRDIKISQPIVDELSRRPFRLHDLYSKWKQVAAPIRWATEGVIFAAFVGMIIFIIPPKYLPWSQGNFFTLIEVESDKFIVGGPDLESVADTQKTAVVTNTEPQETSATNKVSSESTNTNTNTVVAVDKKESIAKNNPNTTPTAANLPAQDMPTKVKVGKGFVYRANLRSSDIDVATADIREKIIALGGQKAGEVELGWRRQQGSYFHFAMPEQGFNEILEFFKERGTLKISKDPHPRVMPDGIIRIILYVESGQSKARTDSTND